MNAALRTLDQGMASTDNNSRNSPVEPGLETALAQIREQALVYNQAVGSYNTHLDNHRDRSGLHDIPFRDPITKHDSYDAALGGDPVAIGSLLTYLIDQAHLDSELRRHEGTFPIHIEACDHLEIARKQLITTLEETLRQLQDNLD